MSAKLLIGRVFPSPTPSHGVAKSQSPGQRPANPSRRSEPRNRSNSSVTKALNPVAVLLAAVFSLSNASPLTEAERMAALYAQPAVELAFSGSEAEVQSAGSAQDNRDGLVLCRSALDGSVQALLDAGEQKFRSEDARHIATDLSKTDSGTMQAIMMMNVATAEGSIMVREVRATIDMETCEVSNISTVPQE